MEAHPLLGARLMPVREQRNAENAANDDEEEGQAAPGRAAAAEAALRGVRPTAMPTTTSGGTSSSAGVSAFASSSRSQPQLGPNGGGGGQSDLLAQAMSASAIFMKEFNNALRLRHDDDAGAEYEQAGMGDGMGEEGGPELDVDELDELRSDGVEGRRLRANWSFHGTDTDEVDVRKGAEMTAMGRNSQWYLVSTDKGELGLIPVSYCSFVGGGADS